MSVGLVSSNMFKPSSIFTDNSKAVLLLCVLFVIVSYMSCCLGVLSSLCVTCLERANCFALLYVTFSSVLSITIMVFYIMCGI